MSENAEGHDVVVGVTAEEAGTVDGFAYDVSWPDRVALNPIDWGAISALAGVAALFLNVVLLLTIFFAYKSVRDGQRSHVSSLLAWASGQMDSIKEDLDLISLEGHKDGNWTKEYEAAARRASRVFQRLGYLAQNGLIHPLHFRKMWGLAFVKYWELLGPWVKECRRRNGEPVDIKEGAFSRVDFEALAMSYRPYFEDFLTEESRES